MRVCVCVRVCGVLWLDVREKVMVRRAVRCALGLIPALTNNLKPVASIVLHHLVEYARQRLDRARRVLTGPQGDAERFHDRVDYAVELLRRLYQRFRAGRDTGCVPESVLHGGGGHLGFEREQVTKERGRCARVLRGLAGVQVSKDLACLRVCVYGGPGRKIERKRTSVSG